MPKRGNKPLPRKRKIVTNSGQAEVNSVVAHEFAHVLLHPIGDHTYGSIEWDADKKIQQWGFKPTSDWDKD